MTDGVHKRSGVFNEVGILAAFMLLGTLPGALFLTLFVHSHSWDGPMPQTHWHQLVFTLVLLSIIMYAVVQAIKAVGVIPGAVALLLLALMFPLAHDVSHVHWYHWLLGTGLLLLGAAIIYNTYKEMFRVGMMVFFKEDQPTIIGLLVGPTLFWCGVGFSRFLQEAPQL